MFFAIMMFGEDGTEIIYPNPGFPIYESVIRFSGASPVPMRLHESNGFSFDAEEVLALITPRTRLLILNSPANPTGGVVPKAELDRLVAGLERHPHVAVLSDEIYGEMIYEGHAHQPDHLPAAGRPADPAGRLEQNLCDDRLALGLQRLAARVGAACGAAGDKLPFLRERGSSVCRHRGTHRAARADTADGGCLRAAAQ